LQLDVAEALLPCDIDQFLLSPSVGGVVIVDEPDRTPKDNTFNGLSELAFRQGLQVVKHYSDNFGKGYPPALDERLFRYERGSKHALDRAQQPPLDAVDVCANSITTKPHIAMFVVEKIALGNVALPSSSAHNFAQPPTLMPIVEFDVPKSNPQNRSVMKIQIVTAI
jgi:hypothetical protein